MSQKPVPQTILSILGTIACPAAFLHLYDSCDRESEFAAQFWGFAAGMTLAALWVFLTWAVDMQAREPEPGEPAKPRGRRLPKPPPGWSILPLAAVIYAALGAFLFRGQYIDNTVFYLVTRFAPYFFAMTFALLAASWIAEIHGGELRRGVKSRIVPPFVAIAVVGIEKLAIGRVSALDALFLPTVVVLFAALATIFRLKKRNTE